MNLLKYVVMLIIYMIFVMFMVLISVAFLTLLERKMLGLMQYRKGPNKVSFNGILQPFSDAVKLLSKEYLYMNKSNYMMFNLAPILSLILILLMWMIYPYYTNCLMMNLSLLFLMCCFSLSVYSSLIGGWASNSVFSVLGAIRSLAQSISYEVSLSIIMIIPMFMIDSFKFLNLFKYQDNLSLMFFMWPLAMIFLFSIMAELNRTPFDFSEGESELVSGFNVEYSSVGFIMIFLSEYASILFLSFFFSMIYLGGDCGSIMFYLKFMIMVFLIIWIRATLPRFRYDLLMYLCWLVILPMTLHYMLYMIMIKLFF